MIGYIFKTQIIFWNNKTCTYTFNVYLIICELILPNVDIYRNRLVSTPIKKKIVQIICQLE